MLVEKNRKELIVVCEFLHNSRFSFDKVIDKLKNHAIIAGFKVTVDDLGSVRFTLGNESLYGSMGVYEDKRGELSINW